MTKLVNKKKEYNSYGHSENNVTTAALSLEDKNLETGFKIGEYQERA